jgi:chemotaxis signal transduction protein
LGAKGATDYIRGLVPVSERMVVLLDIDRLIGNDMTSLSNSSANSSASASATQTASAA